LTISSRIDAVTYIPEEYLTETPPPPKSVKIDLMRNCNHRCTFCYHQKLAQKTGQMPMEDFQRLVDELADIGVEECAPFYFGEPFMDKRLPDAIKYCKSYAGIPYVFLTTNGVLATEERVGSCMAAGLDSLKFSLNYSGPEQYAEVTQCPPKNFEKLIENIRNAHYVRSGGFKTKLYASYIQYDEKQAERMAPVLAEVEPYLDEIYALPLFNQAAKVEGAEGWQFSGGNQGRAGCRRAPVPCWALFKEGHVNFDMTLCACCFSVGQEFNMGNLRGNSFMDCSNSEKLLLFCFSRVTWQ
jgi:pyruvate-formate lyase-activating enzyme